MFNKPRNRLLWWICMAGIIGTGAWIQFGGSSPQRRTIYLSTSGNIVASNPSPTSAPQATPPQQPAEVPTQALPSGLPEPHIIQDGKCVDIVDGIDDGVPTSGISYSAGPGLERYYKPFGLKMVIAAGFLEGDHYPGVDLRGGALSPVMLPTAMSFESSGEYPDFPADAGAWMYGRYQRFRWHNPDPNSPDIIFYFGHLDVDHVIHFKSGQEYPAGTVIGYLTEGGRRAVSRHDPNVDGYWIYIHTHVQLTQGSELLDLVKWWKTYC